MSYLITDTKSRTDGCSFHTRPFLLRKEHPKDFPDFQIQTYGKHILFSERRQSSVAEMRAALQT